MEAATGLEDLQNRSVIHQTETGKIVQTASAKRTRESGIPRQSANLNREKKKGECEAKIVHTKSLNARFWFRGTFWVREGVSRRFSRGRGEKGNQGGNRRTSRSLRRGRRDRRCKKRISLCWIKGRYAAPGIEIDRTKRHTQKLKKEADWKKVRT